MFPIFEKKEILINQYKSIKGYMRTQINGLLSLYESGNVHNKVTVHHLISHLVTPTDNPPKAVS